MSIILLVIYIIRKRNIKRIIKFKKQELKITKGGSSVELHKIANSKTENNLVSEVTAPKKRISRESGDTYLSSKDPLHSHRTISHCHPHQMQPMMIPGSDINGMPVMYIMPPTMTNTNQSFPLQVNNQFAKSEQMVSAFKQSENPIMNIPNYLNSPMFLGPQITNQSQFQFLNSHKSAPIQTEQTGFAQSNNYNIPESLNSEFTSSNRLAPVQNQLKIDQEFEMPMGEDLPLFEVNINQLGDYQPGRKPI